MTSRLEAFRRSRCSNGLPVSPPVVAANVVYTIGGRDGPADAVVDPRGKGDFTDTHLKWRTGPMPEERSSPVAFVDLVYRFN